MEQLKPTELNKNISSESNPNNGKRHRRKCNYKKINNQTRQTLIEMVYLKDFLLKDAAKTLGINYSTAKTILRIFRIEKRIEKKNADEERELKQIISHFKSQKIQQEWNTKTDSHSENNNMIENKSKERNETESGIIKLDIEENKKSSKENFNCFKAIHSMKESIDNFIQKINELSSSLNICYGQIRKNHMVINNLLMIMNNIKWNVKNSAMNSSSNCKIVFLILSR